MAASFQQQYNKVKLKDVRLRKLAPISTYLYIYIISNVWTRSLNCCLFRNNWRKFDISRLTISLRRALIVPNLNSALHLTLNAIRNEQVSLLCFHATFSICSYTNAPFSCCLVLVCSLQWLPPFNIHFLLHSVQHTWFDFNFVGTLASCSRSVCECRCSIIFKSSQL